jgi:NAD(P)-dependent dehydrogenase (short-subunit alcohol dehydrogenase family)
VTERHVLEAFRLNGRVALITGGGRGLGRVMADAFAQAGADIAIASRSRASLDEAVGEIAAATGRRVQGFTADVTSPGDVDRLVADVERSLGPIDILVNNAGTNIRGSVTELSETDWDTVLDTNLKGPFLCARAVGPKMAARGWGRIVNLASVLAHIALAGRAPYCASKSGVEGLTRVLALEFAGKGVTVNAICPGVFATDMNRPLIEDPVKYKEFVAKVPMGRWGELHELAGVALFLASDASSYMTGTSLVIDGGWSVW